jgi:hypothetical protein
MRPSFLSHVVAKELVCLLLIAKLFLAGWQQEFRLCRVFPTTPHGARGSILRQEYEGLCEKSGCAMRANLEHLDQ